MPLTANPGRATSAAGTRNTAFASILGVVLGGYALFRYQSPRRGQGLVKEDDIANVGGDTKLGRGMVVSKDDAKATMGDNQGHVGRSPRKASNREDF
ncbi:hypothetical protein BJX99DRAFT_222541 [Aspergillus californicus]